MKNNIINKLTEGKIKNPLSDDFISIPIDVISIESDSLSKLYEYLQGIKTYNKKTKVAVVSDENTHFAAGAEVERNLCRLFEVSSVVLPDNVNSNMDNVEFLHAFTANSDLIIAVGGGTINDLCKFASFKNSKSYISVPTCPSVNGFTSANASIEVEGIKKSLPAHLPKAVFADVDILVQAPHRLIISGLGDSLARPTAQADWLLSHYLLGTEYNPVCFDILKDCEAELFKKSGKLLDRDYNAIKSLMETLIVSGLSMYIAGSSNPASQGEHLIAHYMEMIFGEKNPHTYHGEQIAVTSIAMAKLQRQILNIEDLKLHPILHSEAPLYKHFGAEMGAEFLHECSQKEINGSRLSKINGILAEKWDDIRKEISDFSIEAEEMEKIIKSVSGPYTYKHLAWDHDDFQEAVEFAPYLRNRFTFLDLAIGIKGFLEDD